MLKTVKIRTFTMKITATFPFFNLQAKVAIKMAKVAIKMVKVTIKMAMVAIKMAKIAIMLVKVAIKMVKVAIKMAKVAIKAKSFAGHQALFAKTNFLTIRNFVRTFLFRDKCPEQDTR